MPNLENKPMHWHEAYKAASEDVRVVAAQVCDYIRGSYTDVIVARSDRLIMPEGLVGAIIAPPQFDSVALWAGGSPSIQGRLEMPNWQSYIVVRVQLRGVLYWPPAAQSPTEHSGDALISVLVSHSVAKYPNHKSRLSPGFIHYDFLDVEIPVTTPAALKGYCKQSYGKLGIGGRLVVLLEKYFGVNARQSA